VYTSEKKKSALLTIQKGQPNNPLLAESNDKEIVTSTPSAQLLADEELARQLAREEDGHSAGNE
jgi:hypothetical protein